MVPVAEIPAAAASEGPYVDDDYVDDDYVGESFAPRFAIVPDESRERDEERREAGKPMLRQVEPEPEPSTPPEPAALPPPPPAFAAPPPPTIPVATEKKPEPASRLKRFWDKLTNWEASPTLKGLRWAHSYVVTCLAV